MDEETFNVQVKMDTRSTVSVGSSRIHGNGLFAARNFAAGERVIQYVGELISKAESIRRCSEGNQFIFYWNEECDIDGRVEQNLARFANHSCSANCTMEQVDAALWLIAVRDISAGEELTFNYSYDLIDYREHPCSCGAANCVGYILNEEFHDLVRRQSTLLA